MSLLDRLLDGDEGPASRLRTSAKVVIVTSWVSIGLFVVASVAATLLSLSGVADVGSPWDRLFPLVILLLLVNLSVTEGYRRKKLEERVKALEARA